MYSCIAFLSIKGDKKHSVLMKYIEILVRWTLLNTQFEILTQILPCGNFKDLCCTGSWSWYNTYICTMKNVIYHITESEFLILLWYIKFCTGKINIIHYIIIILLLHYNDWTKFWDQHLYRKNQYQNFNINK